MLVAVVVCPHCRRVLVVEMRAALTTCRSCGRRFELGGRKSYYQGEDADEARRSAAKLSLQVFGAGIEAIAETTRAVEAERHGSFEDLVRSLEKRSEFGAEDVKEEIARLRVTDSAERVLPLLLRENRLYEPRPGRFRWVG